VGGFISPGWHTGHGSNRGGCLCCQERSGGRAHWGALRTFARSRARSAPRKACKQADSRILST